MDERVQLKQERPNWGAPEIRDRLKAGHKAWAQMEPDTKNFQALGVPMHPGAKAYYQSKGQWEE